MTPTPSPVCDEKMLFCSTMLFIEVKVTACADAAERAVLLENVLLMMLMFFSPSEEEYKEPASAMLLAM